MSRNKSNVKERGRLEDLRLDGYYNILNKFGTERDSTEHYQWDNDPTISDATLSSLYCQNGLFATIVDAPAADAVKNGFELDGVKDKGIEQYIKKRLDVLKYKSIFAQAVKKSRLYGGSIIVMLVDDGRLLDQPLNWRDVRGVEELIVYGRDQAIPLWTEGYYNSPDGQNYRKGRTGRPEKYQITSIYGSYIVHESRCLVFRNGDFPENAQNTGIYRSWGIPEYMRISRELRNACLASGYSIRILERLSTLYYKMQGLSHNMETEQGQDEVLSRMELLDMTRNLLNMMFLDADGEELGVQNLSLAGVKDVCDNASSMLSAVSHIPQTRLFGRSPAGMNATGEGDAENYREFVGQIQSEDLRDNTGILVDLLFGAMLYEGKVQEIPEYTVTYNSAWSLSDDEKATQEQVKAQTQLVRAQTLSTYLTAGIIDVNEARKALASTDFDPENILTEQDIQQDWGLDEDALKALKIANNTQSEVNSPQIRADEVQLFGVLSNDAEFDESQHKRDEEGKFSEMFGSAEKVEKTEHSQNDKNSEKGELDGKGDKGYTEVADIVAQFPKSLKAGQFVEIKCGKVDPHDEKAISSLRDQFIEQYASSEYENMMVIAEDGSVYYTTEGTTRGVGANSSIDMEGSYNIHTHPPDETQYSFSTDIDIPVAFNDRTAIMEAVDYKYHYRFEVPKDISFEQWDEVRWNVQSSASEICDKYSIDFDNYEENILSCIIQETCARLGIDAYRREKRK